MMKKIIYSALCIAVLATALSLNSCKYSSKINATPVTESVPQQPAKVEQKANDKVFPTLATLQKYHPNARSMKQSPMQVDIYRGGRFHNSKKLGTDNIIDKEITLTQGGHCIPDVECFGKDWRRMSNTDKGNTLTQCMKWVMQGERVYIHCDRGCDRTGKFCFLLGALCGVDKQALIEDFRKSSDNGSEFTVTHAESRGNSYYHEFCGKATTTVQAQKNAIDYVVNNWNVDRNLVNQFIIYVTTKH